MSWSEQGDPWIIFDADNTLWDVESLYDYARREFAKCVKDKIATAKTAVEIEEIQNEIDVNLGSVFGYSQSRFARSFEETILRLLKKSDVLSLDEDQQALVRKARDIANSVFERRACLFKDTVSAMKMARNKGYRIAIFTAGERWVQERRLSQSGVDALCDAADIVDKKTADNLREFCNHNRVDISRSYFIGDSLNSDVVPAKAVGLCAVRVMNKNWRQREHADVKPDHVVQQLSEAVRCAADLGKCDAWDPGQRRVRVIFEGGGVKGIAHVGALKVLEKRQFVIERTAGSSAGAVIAGLVAARYKADDILQPIDDETVADGSLLKESLITRIGEKNWRSISWFRVLLNPPMRYMICAFVILVLTVIVFFVFWQTAPNLLGWYVIVIFTGSVVGAMRIWRASGLGKFGLASLDKFVQWYDELLRESPAFKGKIADRSVTFQDFVDYGLPAPVLIASDLTHQKLLPLTYTDTRGKKLSDEKRQELERINRMPVAEAVAASAALPLVFRPRKPWPSAPTCLLVDGGMLSNLPAWSVVDGQEGRETRVPVIAFSLTEEEAKKHPPKGFKSFLGRLVSTSISGVRTLETRDIEGLHVVNIPTSAEVTAFDMSEAAKVCTYQEGYDAATRALADPASPDAWKLVPPSKMTPALEVAYNECIAALTKHASDLLEKALPHAAQCCANSVVFPHLRVNIMWVTSLGKLRIAYSYGMDTDTDDDLALPLEGGNAGAALSKGRTTAIDMQEARFTYPQYKMSKYEQALVRPTLRALVSVPMLCGLGSDASREIPIEAVLNFDSDDDLVEAFKRPEITEKLEEAAISVVEAWYSFVAEDKAPLGGADG